jgi:SAM-dependent methyltransferase
VTATSDRQLARNIAIHDRIARAYEREHGEIFNPIEQDRLHAVLERAKAAIATRGKPLRALDFGCGSGNLSRHLLDLGFEVVAADVSRGFRELVAAKFAGRPLETFPLDGEGLSGLDDDSFDLVATYSVLHHVPDYCAAVAEMARVTRPGGVIFIDHEPSEAFWQGQPDYPRFVAEGMRFDWHKYLKPSNYVHRLRRVFNPRHSNEGDIHVWPDDHIEWPRIAALLESRGFETVIEEDYLLYRALCRRDVYERYRHLCTDMRAMAFRKRSAAARS